LGDATDGVAGVGHATVEMILDARVEIFKGDVVDGKEGTDEVDTEDETSNGGDEVGGDSVLFGEAWPPSLCVSIGKFLVVVHKEVEVCSGDSCVVVVGGDGGEFLSI